MRILHDTLNHNHIHVVRTAVHNQMHTKKSVFCVLYIRIYVSRMKYTMLLQAMSHHTNVQRICHTHSHIREYKRQCHTNELNFIAAGVRVCFCFVTPLLRCRYYFLFAMCGTNGAVVVAVAAVRVRVVRVYALAYIDVSSSVYIYM